VVRFLESSGRGQNCDGRTVPTGITINSTLPGPTRSGGEEFVHALAKTEGKSFEAYSRKEFFEKGSPNLAHQIVSLVAYVTNLLASATTGANNEVSAGATPRHARPRQLQRCTCGSSYGD
jgi:hypothetical protein